MTLTPGAARTLGSGTSLHVRVREGLRGVHLGEEDWQLLPSVEKSLVAGRPALPYTEALLSISRWCCFTVECVAGLGVEGPQLKLKCCVE